MLSVLERRQRRVAKRYMLLVYLRLCIEIDTGLGYLLSPTQVGR